MRKLDEKDFILITILLVFWIFGAIAFLSSRPFESEGREIELMLIEEPPKILAAEPEEVVPEPIVAEPMHGRELYDFYIDQIHEQHYPDVPTSILRSVMETESHYQPDVGSSAGAIGLMQVIPRYHQHRAEKYHLNDLWDPYTNIITAADLLNELYQTYGDWSMALYGYNHSWGYVNHVLAQASIIEKGGG